MEYTKGEWRIEEPANIGIRGRIISGANGVIATVNDEANAHLIAAAPDLYEACKAIKSLPRKSMLEDCAYQGIPPKKWMREMGPYYDGYNKALEQIKSMIEQPLARAELITKK